ncbi:MAG: hypothetical protein ACREAA_06150 [Candidatus Polarisedimenticolia bacterium]
MRRRKAVRVLVVAAALGAWGWPYEVRGAPSRAPRPPVRVGDASCHLPAGIADTVGHVLVTYRVGESGKVDQARAVYSVVSPAPRRDQVLAVLEACVKGWAYQPAVSSGRAVPEWLLAAFHFFEPAPEGAGMVSVPGGRTIPAPHLETLRREKQALAMFLLSGAQFRSVREAGVELRTDLPGDAADGLVQAVRQARLSFEAAFPQAPAERAGTVLTMHVFGRQEEFNQVVAFDELSMVHVPLAGQYTPDGRMVYLSAGGKPLGLTARVVAHEVTHHLVHQRLYAGRRSAPFWVSEGIAAFIENMGSSAADGDVNLASLDRGLHTEEGYTWMADPDRYLKRIEDVSRDGVHLPVADLMRGRGTDGQDRVLAYGMSWLLVHYLMVGDGSAQRETFRSWVAADGTDAGGGSLLERLDLSEAELGDRLEAHRRELQRTRSSPGSGRRSVR